MEGRSCHVNGYVVLDANARALDPLPPLSPPPPLILQAVLLPNPYCCCESQSYLTSVPPSRLRRPFPTPPLQALVLYVRLGTAATRLLRVERTVCEVQLVLRCFLAKPQAWAPRELHAILNRGSSDSSGAVRSSCVVIACPAAGNRHLTNCQKLPQIHITSK